MSAQFKIQQQLMVRSERVKCVDLHPSKPWLLAALYNGKLQVWDYELQQLIKALDVSENPVRAARFVDRKNWVITGSDDKQVRVYDMDTWEELTHFDAHADYIRCIVVHPTSPFILTSADDRLVKQWDWEDNWTCSQTYDGHQHYVMQVATNPTDNSQFASVSLDKTIKIWQIGSPTPLFSLEGHEKEVNCVSYFTKGDNFYLISGADDGLVKIWDLERKTCVQTVEGHSHNVSAVMAMQPPIPLLLSSSEDHTVRLYNWRSQELATLVNYDMGRVWTLACQTGVDNFVVLGCDGGVVVIKIE